MRNYKSRVVKKASSMTDKEFFTSSAFRKEMQNLVNATSGRYARPIRVIIGYDNHGPVAFTDNSVLYVNANNDMVKGLKKREAKCAAIVGIIAHEIGHVLFTNFKLHAIYMSEVGSAARIKPEFLPFNCTKHDTDVLSEMTEYILHNKFGVIAQAGILKISQDLCNVVEDGWEEKHVCRKFPGTFKIGIEMVSEINAANLEEDAKNYLEENKKIDVPFVFECIVLYYVREHEIIGTLPENELTKHALEVFYRCKENIDAALDYNAFNGARERAATKCIIELWDVIKQYADSAEYVKDPGNGNGANQMPPLPNRNDPPAIADTQSSSGDTGNEQNGASDEQKNQMRKQAGLPEKPEGKPATDDQNNSDEQSSDSQNNSGENGSESQSNSGNQNSSDNTSSSSNENSDTDSNDGNASSGDEDGSQGDSNGKADSNTNSANGASDGSGSSENGSNAKDRGSNDVGSSDTSDEDGVSTSSGDEEGSESDSGSDSDNESSDGKNGSQSGSDAEDDNSDDKAENSGSGADGDDSDDADDADSGDEDGSQGDSDSRTDDASDDESDSEGDSDSSNDGDISSDNSSESSESDDDIGNDITGNEEYDDGYDDEAEMASSLFSKLRKLEEAAASDMVDAEDDAASMRDVERTICQAVDKAQNENHYKSTVRVVRANAESNANVEAEFEKSGINAISNRLQKKARSVLETELNEGVRTGLYMGKKLTSGDMYRRDKAIFSKRNNPEKELDVAVGVLVDQSGSMSGDQRWLYAAKAAAVLYDFCVSLDIPVGVYGHAETSNYKDEIEVFADISRVDRSDRGRISNIRAKSACNHDGLALRCVFERLNKCSQQRKLCFLISDGQPNSADYYNIDAVADLRGIKAEMKRRGVTLVTCAIGDDKDCIKAIYGDSFLDISDLSTMPQKLVEMLKKFL